MEIKKPRIMAVDDETSFIDMLKQYFELRGYEIDVFADGQSGLDAFRRKMYDVVLLDFKMAGMNGDSVQKKIKELKPDVRTIFITAFSDADKTKVRLVNEGAYAYFEKPLSSLRNLEMAVNGFFKD